MDSGADISNGENNTTENGEIDLSTVRLMASDSDGIPSSDSDSDHDCNYTEDSDSESDIFYGRHVNVFQIHTRGISAGLPPGLKTAVNNFCCSIGAVVITLSGKPYIVQTHCHCCEKVHTLFCSAWQQYTRSASVRLLLDGSG